MQFFRQSCAVFLAALLMGSSPALSQSTYDIADRLDLLPTPREISLSGASYDVEGWRIVGTSGADWTEIAAAEINDRIQALGGSPVPVMSRPKAVGPTIYIGRWRDSHIRSLAMDLDVTLTPGDPGPQGYVIEFGEQHGQPVVLLGGSDKLGALYAAVTFRRLLQSGEGRVQMLEASVRDWPDYKIRNNGRFDLDPLRETGATLGNLDPLYAAAEDLKDQVDYFFRHKINYLRVDTFMPRGEGRLFEEQRTLAREIIQYVQARAITTRYTGGVEVGEYLSPEMRQTALERDEGTSYMWSALGAHRRHAEDYAEYMFEGAGVFSLHPYDGGGYLNPERWNDRSPGTKEMYGDDRALADLEQFLMYFNVIRDRHPQIDVEAVVYPYHYQLARDDFPQKYKELAEWMPSKGGWYGSIEDEEHARQVQRQLIEYNNFLDKHLPDGTYIVFREGSKATFEALTRLYEDHPINIWIYPGRNRGWLGTFTPQVRYAKTWYYPDRKDYFYLASDMTRSADGRVIRLAQQEYAWSVDRPDGDGTFENRNRFYEHGSRTATDFQRNHLVPRIARILYGGDAEHFVPLIAQNLSFRYVMHREEVGQTAWATEYFDDNYKYMGEQASEMQKAHESLAELVENGSAPSSNGADAWATYYYRYTGLAAIRAQLEDALNRARSAAENEHEAEAREIAEDMIDQLSSLSDEVDHIRSTSDQRWQQIDFGAVGMPTNYKSDRMEVLDSLDPSTYELDFQEFI
jgi:hypothetical protein